MFIPGGHAPLADLGENADLGRIVSHFHSEQKPTAALYHGLWAFLSTKVGPTKEFAYKGYKMTAWSDVEEKFMEMIYRGEIDKVESTLRAEGADMQEGIGKTVVYITIDRGLNTDDNPMSANAIGDKFLEKLGVGLSGK